jgi:fatty-acid desaturase
MIQGVLDEGFLRVALKDVNQYGPHAMIMLLFIVATVTALALFLSTFISPLSALIIVVTLLSMMGVWFRWRLNPTQ